MSDSDRQIFEKFLNAGLGEEMAMELLAESKKKAAYQEANASAITYFKSSTQDIIHQIYPLFGLESGPQCPAIELEIPEIEAEGQGFSHFKSRSKTISYEKKATVEDIISCAGEFLYWKANPQISQEYFNAAKRKDKEALGVCANLEAFVNYYCLLELDAAPIKLDPEMMDANWREEKNGPNKDVYAWFMGTGYQGRLAAKHFHDHLPKDKFTEMVHMGAGEARQYIKLLADVDINPSQL